MSLVVCLCVCVCACVHISGIEAFRLQHAYVSLKMIKFRPFQKLWGVAEALQSSHRPGVMLTSIAI